MYHLAGVRVKRLQNPNKRAPNPYLEGASTEIDRLGYQNSIRPGMARNRVRGKVGSQGLVEGEPRSASGVNESLLKKPTICSRGLNNGSARV